MSDDSHTITFVSRKTFKPLSNMLVTKISKRDKPELEDMGILKIISDR